ncbi:MAG TPA: hypothetical protein PLZ58_00460 [Candidatus Saccharibacteria bacterium]|nr:hypothetical protein [Candidatus Saccharibacteria bacterium]HRQ07208.1 hypothetical protein [Candidatus Saccharibacteria bacterium]
MVKRDVYNGYEEKFLTGDQIRDLFANSYECFGKHHQQVSSHKINFSKFFSRIKAGTTYRLFLNDIFCMILDNETDAKIYFFGYTNDKPAWAKD